MPIVIEICIISGIVFKLCIYVYEYIFMLFIKIKGDGMSNILKIISVINIWVNDLQGPNWERTMNTNSASNQVLTQPESEYQLPEWDARLTAMIVFSCFSPF